MVKCFWKNKSAYCDEDANCRCGTENEEDDVKGSYRAPLEDFTTLQPDFGWFRDLLVVLYCKICVPPKQGHVLVFVFYITKYLNIVFIIQFITTEN